MKRMLGWFMVAALIGIFSLWVGSTYGSDYSEGKDLFDSNCSLCHGKNGKGDGPAAASFSPHPADFTSPKFWERKDVDQLITNTIQNGHGPMPPIDLNSNQIKLVIDYITHAFKPGSK